MSSLHQTIYHSYMQTMHGFCRYPGLMEALDSGLFTQKVHILALGKCAWKMASLVSSSFRQKQTEYDGFVLTKYGGLHGSLEGLICLEAGHPLPDDNSFDHSARIVEWLSGLPRKDDLIVLLSGGSSALFEIHDSRTSRQQMIDLNTKLLGSGMDIKLVNAERAEHSLVKNGRTLEHIKSDNIYVYAVSDVEGNDPAMIGSGPFTPQTVGKQTDDGQFFEIQGRNLRYQIVADNMNLRRILSDDLKQKGFRVIMEESFQHGSVRGFAGKLSDILRRADSPRHLLKPPFVMVFGGELTLKVTGKGRGGRCGHLALSMANVLRKYTNTALFCFATDGNDNLHKYGGAYVDSCTHSLLRTSQLDSARMLKEFDSYSALQAIHHVLPSPVIATNVNDIFILSVGYDLENPLCANGKDSYDIFDLYV